jgi:hypothetical protein
MSSEDRPRARVSVEAVLALHEMAGLLGRLRPCGPKGTCWYLECDMGGIWPFPDEPAQISGTWRDGDGPDGYAYAGDVMLGATCR